jgi:uncharacterized protein (DUF2252 family)
VRVRSPASVADRGAVLRQSRDRKMARSVHAFVRGDVAGFYAMLDASMGKLPDAPALWICGDCHLGNLGPVADSDGVVDIQIRDLDQTMKGHPGIDLIRLGLSLETAARSSVLPGAATSAMIDALAGGYAQALTAGAEPMEPGMVKTLRREALGRRWRHLATERIDDPSARIPRNKRFWSLKPDERAAIDALFRDDAVLPEVLRLAGIKRGRVRVVDAAFWRKGCSSLGTLRFAVLLGVKKRGGHELLALVDIKEAVPPILRSMHDNDALDPATRVVNGARALAPNLGDRMIPAHLLGRPVVLRELKPQDLKLEIAQFSRAEAGQAASYLGFVLGRAHARQLDKEDRKRWAFSFGVTGDKPLAPSWLWSTVVSLAGAFESGYLEHCRTLILGT